MRVYPGPHFFCYEGAVTFKPTMFIVCSSLHLKMVVNKLFLNMKIIPPLTAVITGFLFFSCNDSSTTVSENTRDSSLSYAEKKLAGYEKVRLTTDISKLTEKERQMIPLLIQAAQIMDDLYWQQSPFYERENGSLPSDPRDRRCP